MKRSRFSYGLILSLLVLSGSTQGGSVRDKLQGTVAVLVGTATPGTELVAGLPTEVTDCRLIVIDLATGKQRQIYPAKGAHGVSLSAMRFNRKGDLLRFSADTDDVHALAG